MRCRYRGPVRARPDPCNKVVEDDVLPSAEHTHEGDQIAETQSIVAAPPQGGLPSVGFQKAGIANQTGARDIGTGDRQGSVRNKRSF